MKWKWDEMATYCTNHPEEIKAVVKLCLENNKDIQINASMILQRLIDKDKNILNPYLGLLITYLKKNVHDAVKRMVIRVFQTAEIPKNAEGELFEYSIKNLKSQEAPIAFKVFSMTVARRICEKYPELMAELIPYLEMIIEEKPSAGLVNRAKKELKQLQDLSGKNT